MLEHLVAPVGRIVAIDPHPNSETLDVLTVEVGNGARYVNVANRDDPATPRDKVGDYVVVLTDNLILPERLLKHLDLWNVAKDKGALAGNKGNRTKGRKIADVMSEVALCRMEWLRRPELDVAMDNGLVQQSGTISIVGMNVAAVIGKIIDTKVETTELSPVGMSAAWALEVTEHKPVPTP